MARRAAAGRRWTAWLKRSFPWLFQHAQRNHRMGTAYVYGDGELPEWTLLGEYDNGSAAARGHGELIWLPTQDGAIPVGLYRNGQFFAIHTDHLGTSRLMTDADNKPVWQWPYSAFGNNKPIGVLQPTPNPKAAVTNQPVLLRATEPQQVLDLRFPGQHFDNETQMADNISRTYWMLHGRYTQADRIGLKGGLNRFLYVSANPLSLADPSGLAPDVHVCVNGACTPPPPAWKPDDPRPASNPLADLFKPSRLLPTWNWDGMTLPDWMKPSPMQARPPDNAYDPNGPKAPGRPGEAEGFRDPKGGPNWVPNPNPGRGGSSHGWQDDRGRVWCPTGQGGRAHGGPHWDVQWPDGRHTNVPPGVNIDDL